MSSVLVYGDVNLNILDGSAVWLVSVAEVLTEVFDEVHVLLKAPVLTDRLVAPLATRPRVTVHPSRAEGPEAEDGMPPAMAADRAAELAGVHGYDAVVVRGLSACRAFAAHDPLARVLWAYVTDLPFPPERLSETSRGRVGSVASGARRMFAQTEAARSYLEALAPAAAGRTVLLPPMVPDDAYTEPRARRGEGPLRLVYAGKLAKDWRVLEMLDLPRALRARGVEATLDVAGDKFQRDNHDRGWTQRMRDALAAADADPHSGVRWHGGLPREAVLELLGGADIGVGWRSRALDSSLEISTKTLECGARGAAPLVNDTADHRQLLGDGYPFLVPGGAGVEEAADVIVAGLPHLHEAAAGAHRAARYYAMSAAADRLRTAFARAGATRATHVATPARPTRLVVASHDLKFLGELMERLTSDPSYEVRVDAWPSLREHDEERSRECAAWADVVLCEWAGPCLAWYARHKRPGQRLVSRLHAFELRGPWLGDVDFAQVDEMVFVSETYRRLAHEQLGLDAARTVVIPNTIDVADLARPKVARAPFHVGLVGMVGFGKRPDRALDVLEELLAHDERYVLHLKGRSPWDYPHEWNKPLQRQLYYELYARIARSEALRAHVVLDPFSPDVASWLRGIGVVLSPSHAESFHLAPAEGMASGAVPLVWERPGAREIFGDRWIVADAKDAARRVLELRDPAVLDRESRAAREYAARWDVPHVVDAWLRTLTPRG